MIANERYTPDKKLLDELLTESARHHRHLCPRQVLGLRMGLYGLRLLGLIHSPFQMRFLNEKKRLLTIVETDGCGADGVAVATDCYVGRRTLRVLDFGKMAATLVDTDAIREKNGRNQPMRGLRIAPSPAARELAAACAPAAQSRWHAYLEAYQVLPDSELLVVQEVTLTQTLAEVLSRPGIRVNCAQCGEEIINEREVRQNGQIICRACAGERYYQVNSF